MTLPAYAERGMDAPPEVVFNTATDPARAAWLPAPLRRDSVRTPNLASAELHAQWSTGSAPAWSARLQVRAVDSGGATARLDLEADTAEHRLSEIADESLANLAREVDDNLTPG